MGDDSSPHPRPIRAVNSSNRKRNINGARQTRNFSSPVVQSQSQQQFNSPRSCSDSYSTQARKGSKSSSGSGTSGRRILGELSLHQADVQARRIRDEKLRMQDDEQQQQAQQDEPVASSSSSVMTTDETSVSTSVSVTQEDTPATPPSLDESSSTINESTLVYTPDDKDTPRTPSKRRSKSSDTTSSSPVTDENLDSPRKERQERQRQIQLGLQEEKLSPSPSKRIKSTHTKDDQVEEDHASPSVRLVVHRQA
ncbi:unnamed protein product [Sympodiomycopsis kandeliae]